MKADLFETKRLILRKITPEVQNHAFETFDDETLISFLGIETKTELQKEKDQYNKGLSSFNRSFLYFQLIEKGTEKVFGWCGYHTWYTYHYRAELGYTIRYNEFKNRGFMSEALDFIIDYGFNTMKLHRIEAYIGNDNVPSLKLVYKLGFEKEGVLKEHYFTNNRMEDSHLFALLKHSYNRIEEKY